MRQENDETTINTVMRMIILNGALLIVRLFSF